MHGQMRETYMLLLTMRKQEKLEGNIHINHLMVTIHLD